MENGYKKIKTELEGSVFLVYNKKEGTKMADKKVKRSERLVDLTHYLLENPYRLIKLNFFVERYGSSKSTISEDLEIVKSTFKTHEIGQLETFSGAAGGLLFKPEVSSQGAREMALDLYELMLEENRILPGGYIYLSDILGNPKHLKIIGKIIAHEFRDTDIDAVMTIATKGIPIAQKVAEILDVPFAIVRQIGRAHV